MSKDATICRIDAGVETELVELDPISISMASPFASAANAKIIFKVIDPDIPATTDEYGNPSFPRKQIEVVAMLNPINEKYAPEPGSDEISILLEGYLVEPLNLPVEISEGEIGEAEIRFSVNSIERGTFRVLPVLQNPFLIAAKISELTKLKGLFVVKLRA